MSLRICSSCHSRHSISDIFHHPALHPPWPATLKRLGGYHPTVIGNRFYEGRYEIAHKLGWQVLGDLAGSRRDSGCCCMESKVWVKDGSEARETADCFF